jgi:methionine biosynthesis protein MetW
MTDRIDLLLICDLVEPDTRVLDIGCGQGDLLALLKQQKNIDGRGLEISQSGVNACVARGLSVVQGDADRDLAHYPDRGFDYAILSQTLQATQRPDEVLRELARIGKKLIVSFPNFGHWRVRLDLLCGGRMPETKTLSAKWYNTPNIHLCTLMDFVSLCDELGLKIEKCTALSRGQARQLRGAPGNWQNLIAEQAVFLLSSEK